MSSAALAELTARVEREPQNPQALEALGHALRAAGKLDEALLCFRCAIALLDPDKPENHYELGNAYYKLQRYPEAEHAYKAALRIKPAYAEAQHLLAATLYHLQRFSEALRYADEALSHMPENLKLCNLRGNILQSLGDYEAGEASYRATLTTEPENIVALNGLARIQMLTLRTTEAVATLQQALALNPAHPQLRSLLLYTLHHLEDASPAKILQASREWEDYCGAKSIFPPVPNTAEPERRLRVGFVSGDFRQHPVSYFIEPVFARLDARQYEIHVYSNQPEMDEATQRLMHWVPNWHWVAGDPDEALAERIRAHNIDILVDLSGHTDRNRLNVFTRKPSPVQMSWLGYFGTTGLSTMDYIIADHSVIPPGETGFYIEKPLYMPDGYLCFTPPPEAPEPGPTAEEAGRPLTFVSFNNIVKISPSILTCWARILHHLPGSILRLQHRGYEESNQKRIWERFAAHGIGPERIIMGDLLPRRQLLEAYQEADLALDTYPYNGGTTTVEALYMGVPVVTLQGEGFVRRVGTSILTSVGLNNMIASTPESYVQTAIALARDATQRAALRKQLRPQVINSPLCDGTKFARNLEKLWRAAWHDRCATRQA